MLLGPCVPPPRSQKGFEIDIDSTPLSDLKDLGIKLSKTSKTLMGKKNWPTYPFFQPCYLKQSFFFLPYLLLNDWVDDTQGLHIGFMRAFRRASSRCQAHKPPNLVTTMIAVGGQREATDAWRPCSETTAGKLGPAAGKPLVYCKIVLISRTAI